MTHPQLSSHLSAARYFIQQTSFAAPDFVKVEQLQHARTNLLQALAIAKTLGLGSVVARVLLALREVGKANRQLVA